MSELPRGWAEATLGDISQFVMGQAPPGSASNFEGIGTPFVKAGEFGELRPIVREWTTQPLKFATRHDVLICVVGATAGKINLGEDCAIGRSVAAIRPADGNSQFFIYNYLKTKIVQLRRGSVGSAQGVISKDDLGDLALPLPPLAEQERIVSTLDALNAKSARARIELVRIKTLVSRYKQAVLGKAFSGELTSAGNLEANGGRELGYPPHWKLIQLGDIADIKSGITLGKKRKLDEQLLELPYLRVANVQRGWLDLSEIKTIAVTAREADALFLREGDVLMNEGGDRDKLGRGWVWDGQIADCIHQNHVFRVRLGSGTVPPRFLSYFANEFGQKHFFDEGKQTTNLASISKSKLSQMMVPVPPFEEAKEIVRRIESAYAKMDRLAGEAMRALELVGRLDEAILAKAFRGELVPQDENDEPAEKLLARIRTERETAPKVKRRTRSTASKMTAVRKGTTEMAKTRKDVEKDHLCQILRVSGGTKSPTDLWRQSGMDIDEFYKQLRSEIDSGQIREGTNKDQLEVVHAH